MYNPECERYLNKVWNNNGDRVFNFKVREFRILWIKASEHADTYIRPQILRKWQATMLGELGVPDRYVDIFQGRAPRTVLAKHCTGKALGRLKRIYDKADITMLS